MHAIWRKRCLLVHLPERTPTLSQTTDDSLSFSTPTPDANYRSRRWHRRKQTTSTSSSPTQATSQSSLRSYLTLTPVPFSSNKHLRTSRRTYDFNDSVDSSPSDTRNAFNLEPSSIEVPTGPRIRPIPPATRSTTNLLDWHFRDRINVLDMVLSTEWAPSLAPSCAHLLGHFTRIPQTSHYFFTIPLPGLLG